VSTKISTYTAAIFAMSQLVDNRATPPTKPRMDARKIPRTMTRSVLRNPTMYARYIGSCASYGIGDSESGRDAVEPRKSKLKVVNFARPRVRLDQRKKPM